jgi:hypothetical protein
LKASQAQVDVMLVFILVLGACENPQLPWGTGDIDFIGEETVLTALSLPFTSTNTKQFPWPGSSG